jgi:hypothetical protein
MMEEVGIDVLVGKTISVVTASEDSIRFHCTDGSEYLMEHDQDCCEWVRVEDIDGDIQRLVGQQIVVAEERTSQDDPPEGYDADDSFTWTFYALRTNLDSVTIRWLGESNGYYSEGVEVYQVSGPANADSGQDAR